MVLFDDGSDDLNGGNDNVGSEEARAPPGVPRTVSGAPEESRRRRGEGIRCSHSTRTSLHIIDDDVAVVSGKPCSQVTEVSRWPRFKVLQLLSLNFFD